MQQKDLIDLLQKKQQLNEQQLKALIKSLQVKQHFNKITSILKCAFSSQKDLDSLVYNKQQMTRNLLLNSTDQLTNQVIFLLHQSRLNKVTAGQRRLVKQKMMNYLQQCTQEQISQKLIQLIIEQSQQGECLMILNNKKVRFFSELLLLKMNRSTNEQISLYIQFVLKCYRLKDNLFYFQDLKSCLQIFVRQISEDQQQMSEKVVKFIIDQVHLDKSFQYILTLLEEKILEGWGLSLQQYSFKYLQYK